MTHFPYITLEHLATAVVVLDDQVRIAYLNPAAENLFEASGKNLYGLPLPQVFSDTEQLICAIQQALQNNASYIEHDLTLGLPTRSKLHLRGAVTLCNWRRNAFCCWNFTPSTVR